MMAQDTSENRARMTSTTLATMPVCWRRSPIPPEKAVVWRRMKTAAEDTHTSLDWADERKCHDRLGYVKHKPHRAPFSTVGERCWLVFSWLLLVNALCYSHAGPSFMLKLLRINNIALIQSLEVEFGPGL